jgi:exonuclease I
MTLEEFIEASNRAQTVDELFELYKRAMTALGFDRIIFSLMTDHVAIRRRAGHGIIRNYPSDWMVYYGEKNYEALDPVRQHVYAAYGAFTWDDLLKLPIVTEKQHDFMKADDRRHAAQALEVLLHRFRLGYRVSRPRDAGRQRHDRFRPDADFPGDAQEGPRHDRHIASRPADGARQ